MADRSAMRAASAAAAVVDAARWDEALGTALGRVGEQLPASPDLVLIFASAAYAEYFPHIAAVAQERTGARVLAGCSGQGVIGPGREVEDRPAIALLAACLPGAELSAAHISQPFVEAVVEAEDWWRIT